MKPNGIVRTRFAPSPTGFLHLGSARTALFNYLFANHYGGKFIVRFEDTDQTRHISSAIPNQLTDLRWLGLKIDETIDTQSTKFGPYLQSQRLTLYQKYSQQLFDQQQAYYCFCTTTDLQIQKQQQLATGKKTFMYDRRCHQLNDQQIQTKLVQKQPFCLRFYVPANLKIRFQDLTFGEMTFVSNDIEDFVIIKQNTYPTYNFANVIDDYSMKISHVLRGMDHLSNTAKQILLYQIFQWPIPTFGHFTLLQVDHHQKISKRHFQPQHYLDYYRQIGVLPVAMTNFLALLGWSPSDNQEFLTLQQAVQRFDGKRLSRSPSILDSSKLYWLNRKHLQQLSPKAFFTLCQPYLKTNFKNSCYSLSEWRTIVALFQTEVNQISAIQSLTKLFCHQKFVYSQTTLAYFQTNKHFLTTLWQQFSAAASWKLATLKLICQTTQTQYQLRGAAFYHPLRLAISGQMSGPPFYDLLVILGAKVVLSRLTTVLDYVNNNHL